jgi:DNA-binding transcriptional regulator WhiA
MAKKLPRNERYKTITIRKKDWDVLDRIQRGTGWTKTLIFHFIIEHHAHKLPENLTDIGYIRLGNTKIAISEIDEQLEGKTDASTPSV